MSPLFPSYWEDQFLITAEGRRREHELKMGKWDSPRSEWDTGFSVPRAFKLDHLQPVKLILSQKFPHLFALHTGRTNSLLLRREEGMGEQGVKIWKMGFDQKWSIQGIFGTWGNIWRLLSWLCSKVLPLFCPSYWEVQFLNTAVNKWESGMMLRRNARERVRVVLSVERFCELCGNFSGKKTP